MKAIIHGHATAYDDTGRGHGPSILFVHGYPLDRSMWKPQLDGLHASARCVALDLRGFGESNAAGETSTMDSFATDVVSLMDRLQIERAVLCGLSMGGYIVLAFAAHWPDRLAGVILAHTLSGADSEAGRAGRMNAVKVAEEQGAGAIAEGLLPRLLAEKTRNENPELVEQVRALMTRQPVPGITAALRGMAARPDRTPLLARIRCPALVITGAADTLIPPSESEALAAAIPDAKLVVLPDAGHLSNTEQPAAFNEAVKEFIRR